MLHVLKQNFARVKTKMLKQIKTKLCTY